MMITVPGGTQYRCDKCDIYQYVLSGDPLECKGDISHCGLKRVNETAVPSRAEQISPERARTHGLFSDNAEVAITIRNALRSANNFHHLTRSQQLALEEIALKLARIVSVENPSKEHWDDIEGYAKLGGKDCV